MIGSNQRLMAMPFIPDAGHELPYEGHPMYERLVALAECGEELPPPLGRFLPKKSDYNQFPAEILIKISLRSALHTDFNQKLTLIR